MFNNVTESLYTLFFLSAVAYILLFTQMGFGEAFYYTLSNQFGDYSQYLAGILLISAFLFYILDIDEWSSKLGKVVCYLTSSVIFLGFILLVMLVSNDYPYGIITMFALFNPLWLLVVKSIFYRTRDTRLFVSWLSGPLLLISVLIAGTFIGWVFWSSENQWNSVTKVEAAERTGCAANFEEYPNCINEDGTGEACFYLDNSEGRSELTFPDGCDQMCINVYSECSNGLILWSGPVLMCLTMIFLCFFCTFLRTGGTGEKDIFNFGKIWIFALCVMWASASLSGTAAGVTSSLVGLTLASLLASAIFLSASFSKDEVKTNKESIMTRIREKYGDNLDVARGLFIVTCSPIVFVYFGLSMINQVVRRIGINPCSQPSLDANPQAKGYKILTVRANKHLNRMRAWDRASVLTYAVYWGVAYMILNVIVSQLTVVFLSWMIEKTANFSMLAVTGIMCGVGVLMFLLPPVPGVPVYLTLGIVLTAQGYETIGEVHNVVSSFLVIYVG